MRKLRIRALKEIILSIPALKGAEVGTAEALHALTQTTIQGENCTKLPASCTVFLLSEQPL